MQGSCERRNKRQHLQSQQARRRDQTHMEQRECGKMKGDHERKKKPKKKKENTIAEVSATPPYCEQ